MAGKTTLVRALAGRLGALVVPEYADLAALPNLWQALDLIGGGSTFSRRFALSAPAHQHQSDL